MMGVPPMMEVPAMVNQGPTPEPMDTSEVRGVNSFHPHAHVRFANAN